MKKFTDIMKHIKNFNESKKSISNDIKIGKGKDDHLEKIYKVYLSGKNIGHYILGEEDNDIWLNGIEIDEKYRGRGLSKKILNHILISIKSNSIFNNDYYNKGLYHKNKKYNYLKLMAWKSNTIANNLYLSFGFELFKKTKDMNYYKIKL
jgi:ribosomal protein S18 acetylase RimI-like enzyme